LILRNSHAAAVVPFWAPSITKAS